jgi:hypothetical protein
MVSGYPGLPRIAKETTGCHTPNPKNFSAQMRALFRLSRTLGIALTSMAITHYTKIRGAHFSKVRADI